MSEEMKRLDEPDAVVAVTPAMVDKVWFIFVLFVYYCLMSTLEYSLTHAHTYARAHTHAPLIDPVDDATSSRRVLWVHGFSDGIDCCNQLRY